MLCEPGDQRTATEAAHVGTRGLGQKCPGWQRVPLCGEEHHRLGPLSHHVLGKGFWSHHWLDMSAMVENYNLDWIRQL
jgi:hypothetical protein